MRAEHLPVDRDADHLHPGQHPDQRALDVDEERVLPDRGQRGEERLPQPGEHGDRRTAASAAASGGVVASRRRPTPRRASRAKMPCPAPPSPSVDLDPEVLAARSARR